MKFNFNNSQPIYLQLVEQLRIWIISGRLPPGSKLPSVRELAEIAKVNPNTMQRALNELEDERLIFTERTNGKYVSSDLEHLVAEREHYIRNRVQDFIQEMEALGFNGRDLIHTIKQEGKNL